MQRRAVIRVLNTVGHTSAPLNQFALYRARHYPQEQNIVVSLAPPDQEIIAYCAAQPLVGGFRLLHGGGRLPTLLRVLRKLIAELRSQGPVLLHLHHPASASAAQLLNVPKRVPVVYTVHSSFDKYSPKNRGLAGLNFFRSDHITFVSDASYRAFPHTLTRRKAVLSVSVIPNGVDLERIDRVLGELEANEPSSSPKTGTFKLVTVGRMVNAKNQEFLLEVLTKLPAHITLTMVGGGAKAEGLKALARTLGVADRVNFMGLIPRDEVFRAMQQADVFVSSSFWEGLPVAVLEAMASRLPVVLSDIAPHQELAQRSASLEVLPLEADHWVDTITALSGLPKEELAAVGRENRQTVESHFSLMTMQASYTEVYERLLAKAVTTR